ncbi:hypothetical protein AAFX91_08260 [Bradyrhizobium sp. 31Argb]|uniref:hypothetical protein n=1 Tax=Bradyrhizobium sp. 31Argb TaxID=3141247 RepID=UPI0037489D9B
MHLRRRDRHELESYDEYDRVVVHLDDRTRVIECRDGVQWIVQRGHSVNGAMRWDGVSFCRTKQALLRCAGVQPGENPTLDALPARFPEAREAGTAETAEMVEAE